MNSYNECKAIVELDLDPIKVKLMHQESGEGWTLEQVSAVEVEYRRFLYLMKTFPSELAAPNMDVDTFWHYHILDTMKYAQDCEEIFGHFLHHFPYVGLRGEDDLAAHHRLGERMKELYEETFGEPYPGNPAAGNESMASDARAADAAYSATGVRTAYSATGARTAYSATDARTAYSATGVRTAYSATGTRTAYSATGARTAYSATGVRTAYSATGTRTAYSATRARTAYSASGLGAGSSGNEAESSASVAPMGPIVAANFFAARPQLQQAA